MPSTTDITITLPGDIARPMRSDPIMAAGGLRMMARHLARSIDEVTAHADRLREAADQVEALLADAVTLAGHEHDDRALRANADRLRHRAMLRTETVR